MAKKNRSNNKIKKENSKVVPPKPTSQPKGQLVTYFVIFVFGFLSGIGFTVYKTDFTTTDAQNTKAAPPHTHDNETRQAIINLEAEVTSNPENYQAWIRLGHLYFDSNQPQKAIGAYTKSLELHSGDANLLTDLGIMYRRTNQPSKAITSFNRAIQKDSGHMPSRFNKGIVLLYDLKNPTDAIKSWESILAIDPNAKTPNGEPLQELIDQIKKSLEKNSDLNQ